MRARFRFGERGLWGLLLILLATPVPGAERPVLTTAEQVRRLSAEEADSRFRVRLEGVLTFFAQRTPSRQFRFLQDETAGIYIYPTSSADLTTAAAGQRVEIEGYTGRGEFAPVVFIKRFGVLGEGSFPASKRVSFETLRQGEEHRLC